MRESDSQIYAALQDDLVGYAAVLVGPDAAGDVVSTVVVRVLSTRGALGDLKEPRPYLFRSVLNEATSMRRRSQRQIPSTAAEAMQDEPNMNPEVMTAVLGLPVQQRAATYLVYWVGHTTAATAELMGVGEGTVKRYLSLARTRLKEVLHAHT